MAISFPVNLALMRVDLFQIKLNLLLQKMHFILLIID